MFFGTDRKCQNMLCHQTFFFPMVSDRFGGVMCSEEEIGLHRWLSYIYLLGVLKRCVLGENFWTELAAGKKDFSVRMQN